MDKVSDEIVEITQKSENSENFDTFIIETQNVIEELKSFSSARNISIKYLDFSFLEVNTYFRTNKEEEWENLNEKNSDVLESDDFFVHPELEIMQQYKIEIYDTRVNTKHLELPVIKLGANKNVTKVVATVQKTLDVQYNSELELSIINEINKRKIRSAILVGIREKEMRAEVKKIVSLLRVNGFLEKDITFVVMEGVVPVLTINDDIIYHYKKKVQKEDKHGRIDYSSRGYLLPVNKDEIIMEYIKPQEGRPGKTCRGVYIPIQEPKVAHESKINVTDAYVMQEGDHSIKYIANKNGYVKEEGGVFDIRDEMDIDIVSFRTTGSIEAGLDSNVSINIKESDNTKDAIGVGMKIETSVLNVEGSVASRAFVKANELRIGGQTHQTSLVEAQKAQVAVHHGKLVGKEIEVGRLEGGTIIGDVVKIKSVLGGEVIAREIYIDLLMSNATFITSELIDIKKIKGSDNKFIVDSSEIKGTKSALKELREKIELNQREHDALPKKLESKKYIIDANKGAIEDIKKKIDELRGQNITPPANLIKKIKDFQQIINEYNSLLRDMQEKKNELKVLKGELEEYQNKVYDAKIINHSLWTEYNEIRFRLVSPPVDVIYNTKDGEVAKEMTLNKSTEDEFVIERSK